MLNMMKPWIGLPLALAASIAVVASTEAAATTVPYTESFGFDVAGWEDAVNDPLAFVASGGSDGGGYASGSFNYLGYTSPFGGGPVVLRASASDNASGGAFIGDWLADGVGMITAQVRHDAPEDLTFFMRIATAANFPGAVLAGTQAVAAGEWTQISFLVDPGSPLCIAEGGTCAASFASVGNLQFGTDAPAGLLDDDLAYSIEIDQVSIVPIPEPGAALLLGLGLTGLALAGQRGNRA